MKNNNLNGPELVLNKVLKRLIQQKGLTIVNLSRATGVPIQTLHGWLQGSEPKKLRQVKKVSDFLGVNLDYLCFEVESRKPNLSEELDEINTGPFEVILRKMRTN